MKRTACLFLFFSICLPGVFALNITESDKRFVRAEEIFKGGSFLYALPLYLEIYKSDVENSYLSYKIGLCYLQAAKEKQKAVYYLKKAVQSVTPDHKEGSPAEKRAPLRAYMYLGDAHHLNLEFTPAILAYDKCRQVYNANKKKDNDLFKELDRKIILCTRAKALVAIPVPMKIENLGKNINSPYADYSPVVSADQSTLIFTSSRPENIGGQTYDGGKHFEDIYISTRVNGEWSKAVNIGSPVNTVENEASVAISADGQEILIYKDDMGDGNIYSTSLQGDVWSTPVKLNSNINSKSWEPSAFISADGNSLYFTSNRSGGFGGRDIYKSKKTPEGDWGKAVNLGPTINTPYEEDAPFLHSDGITLYFSSTGHKTMGGFDIFSSKMTKEGTWSEVVNAGYPINSPGDDVFYNVSPDNKTAYYTSYRAGGYGEKDNYRITFPAAQEPSLALFKGRVVDAREIAVNNATITVTDNETENVMGVYCANAKTGKYAFILTPGKSHNISYEAEGFLFYSENRYLSEEDRYRETEKAVRLPEITTGSKVVLNNVFFDCDQAVLRQASNSELSRVAAFLIHYPRLDLQISGYADSNGADEYNKRLSLERAQAVVNFLVEKGIKKDRMIAVGNGETNPATPVKKAEAGDPPDGRLPDPRVELKIIAIQ